MSSSHHINPVRAFFKKYGRLTVSLAAVGCIPLIYAALLIASNHDPTSRLHQVPALIVNEDTEATVQGEKVNLGDEITEEMLEDDDDQNLDWETSNAKQAKEDLKHGRALAVLTIPDGFTEKIAQAAKASEGKDDPAKAASAHLKIQTNDATNFIMGTIGNSVEQKLTAKLRSTFAKEYLENVYVSFTDIHGELKEAADGSGKVTDGAEDAHDASGELVVGLLDLSKGTKDLKSASGELDDGAKELDSGTSQLHDGTKELKQKTADLPSQAKELDSGARQLAGGAGAVDDAVQKLASGASELRSGTQQLDEKVGQINGQAQKLANSNQTLLDAVADMAKHLDGVDPQKAVDLQPAADRLDGAVQRLSDSPEIQEVLKDNPKLADELKQARSDASDLRSGVTDVRTSLEDAKKAAGGSADPGVSLDDLQKANDALRSGSSQLKSATGQVDDGAGQLNDGLGELSKKTPELSQGASELKAGTGELAKQAPVLAGAVGQLDDGAASLDDGTATLVEGTGELVKGVKKLDDGASQAHSGAGQLDDGLGTLQDGSEDLTSGLKSGAKKVPEFNKDEQKQLADVNSEPITGEVDRLNKMENYGTGLSPYFMSLALWIGGIAFFMLLAPIPERMVARYQGRWFSPLQMTFAAYSRAAIMAIVQAAVITIVVQFVFGMDVAHPFLLWGLATLGSLAFLAVNQGLVALLGAPGRFASLVLVVLQIASAGGTYPWQTMPGFLKDIHPYLPMTYTVEAFRSLIGGGEVLGTQAAATILLLWLIGGLALLLIACILVPRVSTFRDWATLAPGLPGGGKAAAVAATENGEDVEPERATASKHAATSS